MPCDDRRLFEGPAELDGLVLCEIALGQYLFEPSVIRWDRDGNGHYAVAKQVAEPFLRLNVLVVGVPPAAGVPGGQQVQRRAGSRARPAGAGHRSRRRPGSPNARGRRRSCS